MAIRTLISISSLSANGSTALPIVAADATLNLKSTALAVDVVGLKNLAKFTPIITALDGKEFTVQNYPDCLSNRSQLIAAMADTSTTTTPTYLGRVVAYSDTALITAPAISLALTEILAGKSCNDAQQYHYKQQATVPRSAITAIYVTIVGACDATIPNQLQKNAVANYLANLKTVKQ